MAILRIMGVPVSDEASESAGVAVRNYFGALGFIIALIGAEMMAEKAGDRFWLGLVLVVAGLPIFLSAWFWKKIRTSARLGFAADPRWWIGTFLTFLLVVALLPYVEQRRFPYAYLFGVGRHPPIAQVEFAPTSLRLQFNAAGTKPQEIETQNIEWTWAVPTKSELKPAPPPDPILCPSNTLIVTSAFCQPRPPTLETTNELILFLVFRQPLPGTKEIKINSHGASLPKWDTYALDEHKGYIWFRGDLVRMVIDISLVSKQ